MPFRFIIRVYLKLHQLDIHSVSLFVEVVTEDPHLDAGAVVEDVQTDLVRCRQIKSLGKTHLIVEIVS